MGGSNRKGCRTIKNSLITKTALAFILALSLLFATDNLCKAISNEPKACNATDTWIVDMPEIRLLGNYYITGYVPTSPAQTGKLSDSPNLDIGAAGVKIIPGKHVAMYGLPFGTKVLIDGLGVFEVMDRGVGRGCVDVACETNAQCFSITGRRDVYIIE